MNAASAQTGPLKLYFMRHGETAWSLSGQHTGRTDLALTPQGEIEGRQLLPHLRDISFSHVLTSPSQRAQQTCALAGLWTQAEIEPDLSEWDYGDYEGLRSVDIRQVRPNWNVFQDGCPQGETPAQISDRADRLIRRLRTLSGNVALFSHGQIGRVLAMRWIGQPVSVGQHFALNVASLSVLASDPAHPEMPVIEMWNEIPKNSAVQFNHHLQS